MNPRSSERRDRATDTATHKALMAALVLVPSLLTAATTYLTTATKAKESEAKVLANYGSYVEEQLRRDEAILKALQACGHAQAGAAPTWGDVAAMIDPELPSSPAPQAQSVLDDVARQEGWKPSP